MRARSLIYHDVVEPGEERSSGFAGADADLYKLDRRQFEAHLDAIGRVIAGPPVTAAEVLAGSAGVCPLLLTFDDGGAGAWQRTADMLERRGWRGNFLIVTDAIGRPGFLSRAQIRDLRARGHVIGSHSCSHPIPLTRCPWPRLLEEWRRSVETLEEILGEKVSAASVPGGYYSRKVSEAAAAAGIRLLFCSEPVVRVRQVDGCLVLGRYGVRKSTSGRMVADLVAGRAAPRLREYLFWNGKKVAKSLGGKYWLAARKFVLNRRR